MMGPANCSPVQVAGTRQKKIPPDHCLSEWQLYVSTQRPNGGRWATELAARLRSSIQLGYERLD